MFGRLRDLQQAAIGRCCAARPASMAPRMVFAARKSVVSLTEKSVKRSKSFRAPEGSSSVLLEPTPPTDPDAYPVGTGILSVRHVPMRMLVEDNICFDYLLMFSRKEFSSEPIELLLLWREIERERTRQQFTIDQRHIRDGLASLIRTHVAEDAQLQVTLPSGPVAALRKWLRDYDALPESGDARSKMALPSADLDAAVSQCMRDIKNDMLPRFIASPLGEELSRLHIAALLSHPAGHEALRAMPLEQRLRDAIEFFVAAHGAATSAPPTRAVRPHTHTALALSLALAL